MAIEPWEDMVHVFQMFPMLAESGQAIHVREVMQPLILRAVLRLIGDLDDGVVMRGGNLADGAHLRLEIDRPFMGRRAGKRDNLHGHPARRGELQDSGERAASSFGRKIEPAAER